MESLNRTNVSRGVAFSSEAKRVLSRDLGIELDEEVPLSIGDPPKAHRFDLASRDGRVAVECKAYTWTASGNVPSAKITTTREALLYLQWLPAAWSKAIAMMRSTRSKNPESLAEYFVRLNRHLLGEVAVIELSDGESRVLVGRWPV